MSLQLLLDSEKAREALFAEQPSSELVMFLRRVGAFVRDLEDVTDPQNTYGNGGGRLVREAAPLDAQMPFEEYRHLMQMGSAARILVAKHPATPDSALVELAADVDEHVATAVCARADLSANVTRVLASHPNFVVHEAVAQSPRLDRETIERLSRHSEPRVRLAIAKRTDLEPATFLPLATELVMKNVRLARVLVRDQRLTPELRARLELANAPRPKKRDPH